jgi:hypothetical protein
MDTHPPTQLETPPESPWGDPSADRPEYVERLVRHRCGDALGEADIAQICARLRPPEINEDEADIANLRNTGEVGGSGAAAVMMIPPALAERLSDVLELIVARVNGLEGWIETRGTA